MRRWVLLCATAVLLSVLAPAAPTSASSAEDQGAPAYDVGVALAVR